MRRLVPVLGAAVVLGALVLLAVLAVVDDSEPNLQDAAPAGQARGRDETRPAPVVEADARRLLERAAGAPATASYTGTQFVSAWTSEGTTSQVLEVSHTAEQPADPSLLDGNAVALMSRHYSLTVRGSARVAGRDVDVVEARRPADAGIEGDVNEDPVVARFWLDRATGLALRREVYDRAGRRIRASAFVDITVRESTGGGRSRTGSAPWPSTLDVTALRRLRTSGWDCPSALPGPLPLVDARRGGAGGRIVHLSYADGIASISLFQQRGRLDREQLRGYRRETLEGRDVWVRAELPRRIVWSSGGMVYTVVADAPERTVDRAVDVLHEGADEGAEGPMDRLGRGLDRVGSWFNPFE